MAPKGLLQAWLAFHYHAPKTGEVTVEPKVGLLSILSRDEAEGSFSQFRAGNQLGVCVTWQELQPLPLRRFRTDSPDPALPLAPTGKKKPGRGLRDQRGLSLQMETLG